MFALDHAIRDIPWAVRGRQLVDLDIALRDAHVALRRAERLGDEVRLLVGDARSDASTSVALPALPTDAR